MLYKDFYIGSYKEVTFLVPSESVSRGKKTVIHEYPNSDSRYVEELGKIPPVFSMQLIIHGDNLINKRLKLENALESPGVGRLVHPVYGKLQVTIVGEYTVSSNQTKLGEFVFSVTFAISTAEAITPFVSTIDEAQVSKNAQEAQEEVNEELKKKYAIPDFSGSINAVADKITGIASSLNGTISDIIEPIQDNVAAFQNVVSSIESGAFSIIQNVDTLVTTFEDLYDSFLDIVATPQNLINSWNTMADFGDDDLDYESNTQKRLQIATDSKLLNEHTQLVSLIRSYEAYVYNDYLTEDDLDEAASYLEGKFDELTRVSLDDMSTPKLVYSSSLLNRLNTLRDSSRAVFEDKAQNLYRIVSLDIYRSSATLLVFKYYNSLDLLDTVTSLNPNIDPTQYTGTIKAVS